MTVTLVTLRPNFRAHQFASLQYERKINVKTPATKKNVTGAFCWNVFLYLLSPLIVTGTGTWV